MPNNVRVRRRATTERTRMRLAERRRKRRRILGIGAFVLAIALFGGFLYVVRIPELTLKSVKVEGTYAVSSEAIKVTAELLLKDEGIRLIPKRMIFTYPKNVIAEQLLAEHPGLRAVEISRIGILSRELVITVSERLTYGIWCTEEMSACYQMDAEGFIYAPADAFAEWTIFLGGVENPANPIKSFFYPAHMAQLRELLGVLPQQEFDPHIVTVMNANDIDIELLGGLRLLISLTRSTEEILSALSAARSSEALSGREADVEYIDVRFGNRVYYKFK